DSESVGWMNTGPAADSCRAFVFLNVSFLLLCAQYLLIIIFDISMLFTPPSSFGIYIHVPFCKQACSYCDFYFVTKTELLQHYVDRLLDEIDHKLPAFAANRKLKTIYFGGGTPSRLDLFNLDKI